MICSNCDHYCNDSELCSLLKLRIGKSYHSCDKYKNESLKYNYCEWCLSPNDTPEHTFCYKCRVRKNISSKILRAKRKAQGKCIDCGKTSLPAYTRCATCLTKQRLAAIKHKAKKLK